MKKLFYFVGCLIAAVAFVACEDDPKNPGDFSLKGTLNVTSFKSLTFGEDFGVNVAREYDTIYHYKQVIRDTVFDEQGEPMIDAEGNMLVNTTDVYVPATGPKNKGHVVELEPIVRTWTRDQLVAKTVLDTCQMAMESNAKWNAAAAVSDVATFPSYYKIINSTNSGGGDGFMDFELLIFTGKTMNITQPVFTSDSSMMYIVRFEIRGLQYKP